MHTLINDDISRISILNAPYRVCLSVCCPQCIHLVFNVSTRNFTRALACTLGMFLHLNRLDFLIRAAVGRHIRTLNDWRTAGDNLPSTHEMMTSLKYAYDRLGQNSIDCGASLVKSCSTSSKRILACLHYP
jgi:hypothetical protein